MKPIEKPEDRMKRVEDKVKQVVQQLDRGTKEIKAVVAAGRERAA